MNKASLIVIGGFAGAGKTTVASKLSKKYNYPIFSSDVLNDALRAVLHKGFHEVSPYAYEIMWHLVRKQLATGVTVLVDTHMSAHRVWQELDAIKSEMPDIQILPIILQANLETHRSRIEERGRTDKDHLNLGGDKFEDILFKYEFIEKLDRPDVIRVDANGIADDVYKLVDSCIHERQDLS